jgi:hypothetical protein
MKARRAAAGALVWLLSAAVVLAAEIRVTPLVDNGRVFASFAAADAFDGEAQEVIRSGLVVTLTYDVDLRRPSTLWFDRTVGRVIVAASVKFDTLTGKYQVDRLQGGKIVSSRMSDREDELRGLLTEFEKVPIEPTEALEPNGDYYVRVRLHSNPRTRFSLWSFWPWGGDAASGRASFTYLR